MTEAEARQVGALALTADSGCNVCARELIVKLRTAFPEHADCFKQVYETHDFYGQGTRELYRVLPLDCDEVEE